ncbi:MAG: 3-isopropylmalate dehydrogenase [Paludibacteraceae bacterium]|jgi:3-isopropylmalate dehydrogenase|nr:3-isopropylmalate dehydrogenase [Paludibacteraceae bacterium]MCR5498112.1 3-isopropylmalate dehydrogenase [Paludibacteraceae bacterium]
MKLNLAILPGDGIGPEVVSVALNVVKKVCERFGHSLTYDSALVGACAIDACGDPYPEDTHALCMKADAVLFGAVGDPRFDNNPTSKVRPEQGLLAMRKKLGLYANLRPVETYPSLVGQSPLKEEVVSGADFLCIRELTGGMYFGEKGRKENGTVAYDTCIYSTEEIRRILKLAFEYAMRRQKHLTVVDKANVLESSRLWREVAQSMEKDYPEVKTDYMFVDNAAMQLVRCPKFFDVMVTENTFGDILTDEASVIAGSMGLLASASIGTHTSLFEPIHGSYPQAAGKDIANPLAAVLSAAMMFEYAFNAKEEGALIRRAVAASLEAGIVTEDLAGKGAKAYKTSEVGKWLCDYMGR